MAARAGNAVLGVSLYAVVLVVGLNRAARSPAPGSTLLLAITVVALERPLSLAVPLVTRDLVSSYVILAVITTVAIGLIARVEGISPRDLGLEADGRVPMLSATLIPVGLVVGLGFYALTKPDPVVGGVSLATILPLVLGLAFATGLVEELLFRGLLQRAASQRLGARIGIVYVGLLYALLAAAPWSVVGLALVFATSLGLGALTGRTSSVIPAAAAHASFNVGLLLVGPLVVRGVAN